MPLQSFDRLWAVPQRLVHFLVDKQATLHLCTECSRFMLCKKVFSCRPEVQADLGKTHCNQSGQIWLCILLTRDNLISRACVGKLDLAWDLALQEIWKCAVESDLDLAGHQNTCVQLRQLSSWFLDHALDCMQGDVHSRKIVLTVNMLLQSWNSMKHDRWSYLTELLTRWSFFFNNLNFRRFLLINLTGPIR